MPLEGVPGQRGPGLPKLPPADGVPALLRRLPRPLQAELVVFVAEGFDMSSLT